MKSTEDERNAMRTVSYDAINYDFPVLGKPAGEILEKIIDDAHEAERLAAEVESLKAQLTECRYKALEDFLDRYHGEEYRRTATEVANDLISEYRAKAGRKE